MGYIETIQRFGDWADLSVNRVSLAHNDETDIGIAMKRIRDGEGGMTDDLIDFGPDDVLVCALGIAMRLPDGFEAEIRPRSSLFLKTGLLLSNSPGTIDNRYSGNEDEWLAVFWATRAGRIHRGIRMLQFRIWPNMPEVRFEYADDLVSPSRGGYGTSGGYDKEVTI